MTFDIKARAVVNAAGVWAGGLVPGVHLRPSRGSHIVVRGEALGDPQVCLMLPVPGERTRYVYAVPQSSGLVYVGVTDTPVDGPVDDVPEAPDSDISFLLETLNHALATPLGREDIVGTFAGLRPLLEQDGKASADVSRRHVVLHSPGGVLTVVGGKLTTYRRMAQDAMDAAVAARGLTAGPCITARLPLVGAATRAELARIDAPDRLIRRYGTEAVAVLELGVADPTLGRPLTDTVDVTGAELVFALLNEGAMDIGDLLDRRTRVGMVPRDRRAATNMAEAVFAEHASGV